MAQTRKVLLQTLKIETGFDRPSHALYARAVLSGKREALGKGRVGLCEGDDNTCVGALCWQKEVVCVFGGTSWIRCVIAYSIQPQSVPSL